MDIARAAPANLDELRALAIGDYQIEAYGDELLDAVHKAC